MSNRSSRTGIHVLITLFAVALGATAGCGGPMTADVAPDASSPAATASTQPAERERIGQAQVQEGHFDGEAVEVFGQERVNAGYAEMVAFAQASTFVEALMPKRDGRTAEDFNAPAQWMTPKMAEDYRAIVDRALAGDEQAISTLQGVSYFGMGGPDAEFVSDGPLVVNHQINNPTAVLDRSAGYDRLQVSFEQRGDLRITSDGSGWLVPLDKTASYWLVPAPGGSGRTWLIDGFNTRWNAGTPTADTGAY